ncbi:MAG: ABC transporter substrate-binding protein, partial [Ruminococcus sp.]|nr:ABC transporter substrate-binding protein [Ruminococcus sp.]
MKKFRTILFFVALIMLVFCSCRNEAVQTAELSETSQEVTETTTDQSKNDRFITLGYYGHYTMNPFTTKSKTNKNVLSLVYDSLFKLNDSYDPQPIIADSYSVKGKTLTVKLKSDLHFSDGAALSAADVIYSFNQAKKSALYSSRLSNFKAAASDDGGVVFSLKSADIYAVNCLDFPVVRAGTAEDTLPVGSGRYIISKKGKTYQLKANKEYNLSEEMEQQQINLLDINTTENELYLLQIGDLSFVYDDMSSDKERSKINANTIPIALNNLVFLGFNNQSEVLDTNVKNAIASAIDKQTISGTAYDLLAKPCATPFNPDWSEAEIFSRENITPDTIKSAELLEKSGYIFAYKNNKFRSKNFEFIELNLIVANDDSRKVECAKLIEQQLESVGISIKIEKLDYEEYKTRLNNSDFDLYIGETKLKPNMDLSVFFSQNGAANYTIDSKSTVANAYSDFISGKIDISTFVQVFNEYKP